MNLNNSRFLSSSSISFGPSSSWASLLLPPLPHLIHPPPPPLAPPLPHSLLPRPRPLPHSPFPLPRPHFPPHR